MNDVSVLHYFNHLIGSSPELFYAALNLSDRLPWLLYALALCAMWFSGTPGLLPERPNGLLRHHARDITIMTCMVMPVLFIISRIIQKVVESSRPMQQDGLLEIPIPPKIWYDITGSFHMQGSFPSDHAVVFFLLATVVFSLNRWWGLLALLLATFFGLLRVALGFHWPSDVLAGAALGSFAGLLVVLGSRWADSLFIRWSRKQWSWWLAPLMFLFLYDCSYKFTHVMSLIHQQGS